MLSRFAKWFAPALCALAAAAARGEPAVRPGDRLLLADRERDAGMLQEALGDYSALIGCDEVPQDRLFLRIGGLCERMGRANDARVAYARAAKLAGGGEVGDYARLHLAMQEKGAERTAALRQLADDAKVPGVRAAALYRLGAALEAENAASAVPAYDRLLAMRGVPAEYTSFAALRKASILSRSGDAAARKSALAAYKAIIEDAKAPPKAAESALFYAGQLAFREGLYAESHGFFSALARRFPGGECARSAGVPHAWAAYMAGLDAETVRLAGEYKGGDAESRAMMLYLQAGALRRMARTADASAAYARLLRDHPGFSLAREARTAFIETKRELGDNAGIAAFARRPDMAPGSLSPRAWCIASDAAAAAGDMETAIAAARAAAAGDASGAGAEWVRAGAARLGAALSKSGAHVQAAAAYREAARRWKDEREYAADAILMAGCEENAAGNAEAAMREWSGGLRGYPGAQAVPEMLFRRGLLEMRAGGWRRAQDDFDELSARHPGSPLKAAALHWAGVAALNSGNAAVAEKRHRAALAASPAPALAAEIHAALGSLLRGQGREAEARAEFAAALETGAPDALPPSTLIWLAEESVKAGSLPVARDALRVLSGKAPDDGWRQAAFAVTGDMLDASGDAAGAREARLKALALDARTAYAARAALALGLAAAGAKDADGARKWLSEAAARAADDDGRDVRVRAWMGLARLERSLGNDGDALRWYILATTIPAGPELAREAAGGAAELLEKEGRAQEAAAFRDAARRAGRKE